MAYKYRCPYCGEPAFSTAERMGIPVGGIGKYAAFFPTCPHCKKIARRSSSLGSWGMLKGLLLLLAGFTIPGFAWGVAAQTGAAVASFALLIVGYVCIYYFVFHFDKSESEARQDPRFTIVVDAAERLPLRVGDIYVCRLLDRNPTNGIPQVIGLVHRIRKEEGKKMIALRVIRCDDADLPTPDERVRVITDGRFDVEGKVVDALVEIEI